MNPADGEAHRRAAVERFRGHLAAPEVLAWAERSLRERLDRTSNGSDPNLG